jgi:hypothetical protein
LELDANRVGFISEVRFKAFFAVVCVRSCLGRFIKTYFGTVSV